MFTEIEIKEIETIKNKDINDLKILLANKTTEMLHGKEQLKILSKQQKKLSLETLWVRTYLS